MFWRTDPATFAQLVSACSSVLRASAGRLSRFANMAMYFGLSYVGITLAMSMVRYSYRFINAEQASLPEQPFAPPIHYR